MINEVTEYIKKKDKWHNQLTQLRQILLSTELQECIKWGMPTYTMDGKNVISFSGYKNHCGLWFFQGSLLLDKYNILSNAQEGKTKTMRHYKLYEGDKIDIKKVTSYIREAIKNQKDGKGTATPVQNKLKSEVTYTLDDYLKKRLDKNQLIKKKFLNLTKIQQRDYSNYITEAKRESTKLSRIEKIIPLISEGNSLSSLWGNKK